ncbi:MAG: IS1 family transposase [Pelatocladus maniniholoensis HA4357-MV3]|uniref:IS1 family transposase n=1 Tax=Pelatocladus maniniholoensis HA4357-MV3 TaxID=1117104 RepID=A0A9E3H6L9_9NOST|nr:IS1 family transposase [Pelatocladus maniniholoensis HA4357-MV3]
MTLISKNPAENYETGISTNAAEHHNIGKRKTQRIKQMRLRTRIKRLARKTIGSVTKILSARHLQIKKIPALFIRT